MFDLAAAKTRLGVADASQDAIITTAIDASMLIAENYCDRKFAYLDESEDINAAILTKSLQVKRVPIDSLEPVAVSKDGEEISGYYINYSDGIISRSIFYVGVYTVAYKGGYETLPGDLETALWLIFDNVYMAQQYDPGRAGGPQKVQITGVGSIDYGGTASETAIIDGSPVDGLLQPYIRVVS